MAERPAPKRTLPMSGIAPKADSGERPPATGETSGDAPATPVPAEAATGEAARPEAVKPAEGSVQRDGASNGKARAGSSSSGRQQRPSAAKGTRPVLALAAESIAAVSGVAETVVDVLHGRALHHYAEGLRQYVTIRLASESEGRAVLNELRTIIAGEGTDALVQPPGIRARLFQKARELAVARLEQLGGVSPNQRAALRWRQPGPNRPEGYDTALTRVRTELGPNEGELLELRFARELTLEELAWLYEEEEETVRLDLEAALAEARALLGDATAKRSGGVEAALLEAFALEAEADPEELEELEPIPPGTVIGGRYEIEQRVGSGAFADVYRGKDTEVPGHVVALKLLHQPSLSEQARASALRELHLIASVFHPSIVQFKDHGWFEQRLWFVMPWYEGETLEARIERCGLSRQEARRIFEPLAQALATMHASGIRHQDVKPDNIFLARLGGDDDAILPVLLDLGVAAKEAEMVVAGTPTYFPPEVAAQFASAPITHAITHKSDVFSLALSLRNALEPETQEDVAGGAVETFIERRARKAPELSQSKDLSFLSPYFERWLAHDPNERPDAETFARELAVLTSPEERRERRNRMLRWLIPAAVTIAVVFGATVFVFAKQNELERLENQQIRAELGDESERRQALEEDVGRIRDRLASSRLTKRELTERLATTQGELNQLSQDLRSEQQRVRWLRERIVATREQRDEARGQLSDVQRNLETTRTELATTREGLADAQSRADELGRQVSDLEGQLTTARDDLAAAQSRAADLESETSTLRGQLEAQEARAGVLEGRLSEAEAAKSRAESELAAARRRIEQLERQVARGVGSGGRVTGRSGSEPPPGGAPDEGGGESGGSGGAPAGDEGP